MIAKIELDYAKQCDEAWLCHVCCIIIEKRHYILCDSQTKDYILSVINIHGSSFDKEVVMQTRAFDTTKEQQNYMSIINLRNFSRSQCEDLFEKESLFLIENSPYEWDVYVNVVDAYKHDKTHKNLYRELLDSMKSHRIIPVHGGGCSQYRMLIEQKGNEYATDIIKYKLCALVDSDCCLTGKGDSINEKKKLYCFLCNVNEENFTAFNLDKIYSLNQSPYIWHMWYKRCIENYFPDRAYKAAYMDISKVSQDLEVRDYENLSLIVKGYEKGKLKELTNSMSRNDYEENLQHFNIDGEDISEIQLLMLKLVKII